MATGTGDGASEDSVRSLVSLIHRTNDASHLKTEFSKFKKVSIEWYMDDDDLDILHHSIVANNIEAVSVLFMKGMFRPPHESPSFSYVHVAAYHGHKSILTLLLQERSQDNKKDMFVYPKRRNVISDEENKQKTPLDIAGERGHLRCVQTLLDFYYGLKILRKSSFRKATPSGAYIDLVCELDSPAALRLILSNNPKREEIAKAVGIALEKARAECLDVLLRMKPDVSSLFSGMNLYHVLYSYCKSFDKGWYESMVSVSAILIKHSHPLIQCKPFRTYPLYSLLAHESCQDLEKSGPFLIACLMLLLNAGADPNFDEVLLERELEQVNIQSAFGRPAYSSALHCLFDTIGNCCGDVEQKATLRHYMSKCTDALLKHRADLTYVGRTDESCNTYGTPLHSFCKIVPKVGLGEKMLRTLLRNGANPDSKVFKYHPLDVLFEELLLSATNSDTSHAAEVENSAIIMDSMSLVSLRDSSKFFQTTVSNIEANQNSLQPNMKKIISNVSKMYTERLSDVWSLQRSCAMTIWCQCRRRMTNILRLPIPKRLRDSITSVIN